MITEYYVSFETAILLKKKGFDMSCEYLGYNIFDSNHRQDTIENFSRSEAPHLYIPTISQARAMKWLREVHNLFIEIYVNTADMHYDACIYGLNNERKNRKKVKEFPTYEQACEGAIKYCLENLI